MSKSSLVWSLVLVVMMGCQQPGFGTLSSDTPPNRPALVPDDELPEVEDPPPPPYVSYVPLSWETSRNPERADWSLHALKEIDRHIDQFDLAKDATRFCPRYNELGRSERVNFWGQLIASISYYESAWNPSTRYHESTMGTDPVTKQPVYSEGLLQLSYQDIQWAKFCEFDWNLDRHLSPTDPNKTIFDPFKNLSCGIGILARQIQRREAIVLTSGVYWAVIRENGRYQKIDQIVSMVQRHTYCTQP